MADCLRKETRACSCDVANRRRCRKFRRRCTTVLVDGHTWALNLRVLPAQRQSGQCHGPAKPHSGRSLAKWAPGPHIAWELETRFATRAAGPDWTQWTWCLMSTIPAESGNGTTGGRLPSLLEFPAKSGIAGENGK